MENHKSIDQIERSIIKSYRKVIWSRFIKSVKEYELIQDGDVIASAISGGKDSLLLAKCLQELQKYSIHKFDLKFIAMDPGYAVENRAKLEENCKILNIPVQIFETDVFEVSEKISKNYPCYMCARMRRGALYAKAQELGCNKLALGHHFNDVIETTMMNILQAGCFKTMLPKLKADNFENMEIIRPLYQVREDDIIRWMKSTGLTALDCACTVTAQKTGSTRYKIKQLIKELQVENPLADVNIFKSCENVNLDMLLAYEKNGEKKTFLEDY